MVSQQQLSEASGPGEEQRGIWLSLFEAACSTLATEPDWKIESITVCSGLDRQTPGNIELLRQSAIRMAKEYGLDAEPEVQGNHLGVRVLRAAWQGDRTPHVCDFAGGHVRVIHALPEVSRR